MGNCAQSLFSNLVNSDDKHTETCFFLLLLENRDLNGGLNGVAEALTACAGAVTGPWEINRDCLQHMSYIIASICTPTSIFKLHMCTSPVISAETEEGRKWRLGVASF